MTLTTQIVAVLLLVVASRFLVAAKFSAAPIGVAKAAKFDAILVEAFRFDAWAGTTKTS